MQQQENKAYAELTEALCKLAASLEKADGIWLLGGSCGLWLQGVALATAPRDIDIYADLDTASRLHERLQRFATDQPRHDRSGLYTSQLSHYRIEESTVELVGGFEVHTAGAYYRTEVDALLAPAAQRVTLRDTSFSVMPLAHELVFNLLRQRPDRYLPIAGLIRKAPEQHLPLLDELLQRNEWSSDWVGRLAELLDRPLLSRPWREYRGEET
ncbi:hypothetical protein IM700_007585 [Paenibacillus sp. DXFW5]|uniref:Nucleotidyltransferase family protein n=1 Tax=Paenibacillus rhizolycopersici TaxID=2780073 RepID=A0ABS2H259_9BACL|nr:hypothetical protein [Paenibacillus rhizolycopersici]MBM6995522.1 hypothetical protein [Paenibacillus rhizolycopersici]